MSAPQTSTASLAAETALATLQGMAPILIQAAAAGAAASSPQGAAAMVAAQALTALIQAQAAGPAEIIALYDALGPSIKGQQDAMNAAAAARGVTEPVQAGTVAPVPNAVVQTA